MDAVTGGEGFSGGKINGMLEVSPFAVIFKIQAMSQAGVTGIQIELWQALVLVGNKILVDKM